MGTHADYPPVTRRVAGVFTGGGSFGPLSSAPARSWPRWPAPAARHYKRYVAELGREQ